MLGSRYPSGVCLLVPAAIHKRIRQSGDTIILEGENLVVDPPRKLVQTYRARWSDDVKAEGESRVTWEIAQVRDSCHLMVTHTHLREGANTQIYGGWPMLLSGLKTLLETGEILTTPGSLRWIEGDPSPMPQLSLSQ